MPKAAEYRLTWNSEQEVYEFREQRLQQLRTVIPGDRAWFALTPFPRLPFMVSAAN